MHIHAGECPRPAFSRPSWESLPKELVARIWPPDRAVQGTRVCKRLAGVLVEHAREIHLSFHGRCSSTSAEEVAQDIARFRGKASLRIQSGNMQRDGSCSCLLLVHGLELASLNLKSSLTHLDLSYLCLGSEGTKRLAAVVLSSALVLQHLNLRSVSMFCEGTTGLAASLSQTRRLTSLVISSNGIKPRGASALAEAFENLNSLEYLDLGDNFFLKEGAQALAHELGRCKALTHIDVSGNLVREEGLTPLATAFAACPRLKCVRLAWTLQRGDDGGPALAALAQCSQLSELVLSNNSSCFDMGLPDILASGAWPHLTLLQSRYNTFRTCKVMAIAHCSFLTELDLSSNCVDGLGQCIAPLLQHCTRITNLNLERNYIERDGVGALVLALRSCTALRHLNLSANVLEDEGVCRLAAEIERENGGLGQHLESLSLNGCLIGAGGIRRLLSGLKGCPRLAELGVGNNVFGDEGAAALAEVGLRSSLRALRLEDSRFSHRGLARTLALAAACTWLQRLDLSSPSQTSDRQLVSDPYQPGWLDGVRLRGIHTLNLSASHQMTAVSSGALAGALKESSQLRHLIVSKNGSTDAGATAIAGGLSHCTSLTHLDMGFNQVGSLGATVLADALRQCPLLAKLNLEFNDVALDGAERLESLQRSCHLLAWINLQGNPLCHGPQVEELFGECGYLSSMRRQHKPTYTR